MPKSIIFTDLLPPTDLSSSVVSGGTLNTGSTYYYVIQACFDGGTSIHTTNGRSQSSNQVSSSISVSGSQSISLAWTASTGAGGYRIYRATSSGSYSNMINVTARTSVHCTGGICSIIDNGYGNPGNTQYQNIVHGKLDLSGSTSLDPFSIVDLYNSSSAEGWGVVNRLDEDTYTINTFVNGHTNLYWTDVDKVIIFRDYLNPGSNATYTFGEKIFNGVTRRGCRLIFKTPDLNVITFPTLFAYKTTFDYVRFNSLILYDAGITPQFLGYSSGSIEYCLINKLRGFPPNSKTLCNMSDTTITEADVALGQGLATFSNVTGMGNSRVFQTGNNTQITGSNIKFIGNSTLLIGNNFSVKYINSVSASIGDSIYNSASSGSTQDVFTYDLQVLAPTGIPISGALVQLYNTSGSSIFTTTTNNSGSISQQEVQLYLRNISGGLGPTQNLSPYTLIVNKDGFNEYREITAYSSSIALQKTIALTETGSLNTNIFSGTFYNSTIY